MKAKDLIKKYEGCKLTTYSCPAGVPTIGYGHTGSDVHKGMVITQEQAEILLDKDIEKVVTQINTVVKVTLNENQMAALISFVFNLGLGNFQHSTLLKKINYKMFDSAAQEFGRWIRAGNQILPGLVARRKEESIIFSTPV